MREDGFAGRIHNLAARIEELYEKDLAEGGHCIPDVYAMEQPKDDCFVVIYIVKRIMTIVSCYEIGMRHYRPCDFIAETIRLLYPKDEVGALKIKMINKKGRSETIWVKI